MNDKVYESYVAKCRELGIKATPRDILLKEDGGIKPNFIDMETKKGGTMSETETVFGKEGVKRCAKCMFTKSVDDFYKDKSGKAQSYCKECKKQANASYLSKPVAVKSTPKQVNKKPVVVEIQPRQAMYLSLEKVKDLVIRAYERGYKEAQKEMQICDISLDEILGQKSKEDD